MRFAFLSVLLILLAIYSPCKSLTIEESYGPSTDLPFSKSKHSWIDVFTNPLNDLGPEFKCFICTLLMTTSEQYCAIHEINLDDFIMKDFCNLLPIEIRPGCKAIVGTYGPAIIAALLKSASPDDVCREIKLCNNTQCNLTPKEQLPKVKISDQWFKHLEVPYQDDKSSEWFRFLTDRLATNHTPSFDIDGDFYSADEPEMRGYNWRGRDCNDLDAKVHPGRKNDPNPDLNADYNCNGISGKDSTGKAYKETLCGNTNQMGIVVMGDSAGAHCEIPAGWMNASAWNETLFQNVAPAVFDEVDLPHFSTYTGYADVGYTGPVRSIYKNLYERNKCNFRDYQNIAVNGAFSEDTYDNIFALSRSQNDDYPLLMFLELIANDVCDHRPTFDTMTTPEQFRINIVKILDHLDTVVPAGSHLVILGLVNGSLVYEGVKDHIHPIGVTYTQFYDWANCIQASFCWGWLNSNETIRAMTTARAMELNQVYQDILSNYTAKNYDFIYYDFPAQPIWDEWVAEGKDPYYLIEPTDGFHPNQEFNALLADYIWNELSTDRPQWLGQENPNNDQITTLFGDQGGY